jgi:hypothetical protein
MAATVFYSWQSDLPNGTNRTLIERALNKAIESARGEASLQVELNLDRDTQDIAGTPEIANTIFEKIKAAQIFVADVSIINSGTQGRACPNPNVLIELGYAACHLGWENIICVFNTAYGRIEDLPFDLRHRRILTYYAEQGEQDRSAERNNLARALQSALQAIVNRVEARTPRYGIIFQSTPWQRFGVRNEGRVPIEILRFVVEYPRSLRGENWSPLPHLPIVRVEEKRTESGEVLDRLILVKTDAPTPRGYPDNWRLPPQIEPGETEIFQSPVVMFKPTAPAGTKVRLLLSVKDAPPIEREVTPEQLFAAGNNFL